VADLLEDMSSVELSGWMEYLQQDDEMWANWLTYAITRAFRVERKPVDDDGEEVIDTTKLEFARNFKGFINTPVGKSSQNFQNRHTEIKMG